MISYPICLLSVLVLYVVGITMRSILAGAVGWRILEAEFFITFSTKITIPAYLHLNPLTGQLLLAKDPTSWTSLSVPILHPYTLTYIP
uniref:Putative secreted protein n=1 Tax=Panstrongylus lignarius TaxID=156445 RepID=A0A224XZ26_9HEMI